MLAPLEEPDRELLGSARIESEASRTRRACDDDPEQEIQDLRHALRESRHRLRRSAWESTRRIAALTNEVNRLSELCASLRDQLLHYESGVAIIELGRRLMQISHENEALGDTARRVWALERAVEAAHAEYLRLSHERDVLAAAACHCPPRQVGSLSA